MYLKDLTLRGFKSFASATKLRFEPGITCVVGPNGSGKSNVVDALSWVMGEQGAKSLRGANMADVIFAGSAGRPALGRAQVDLTIDNSDGRLPISYSEVTISRTMFRSGGSEYAINGQPVRLLDVQELLSDTGMGRQMHSIVGQGQLDRILTASPFDRRAFIDEAAGVAKHRRRKERALRKLETMDANLVRVLDLTEEIRKQLRPLARQAKAAREAAGVKERLDYARARLLAADTLDAHQRMVKEYRALRDLRDSSTGAEQQMDQIRQQISALQAEDDAVSARLDRLQDRYRDFREVAQRLQSVAELARERASSAGRVPVAISDEAVELGGKRATEAARESESMAQAATVARAEATGAEKVREDRQTRANEARTALFEKQRELEFSQRRYADHERSVERAQSVLGGASEQEQRARTLVEEAQERLNGLPTTGDKSAPNVPEKDPARPEGEGMSAHELYERAVTRENNARKSLDDAEREERRAGEEYSGQAARRDTLRRSLGGAQRVTKNAKETSNPPDPSSLSSSAGALATFLKVETGWEEAVGALLGLMVNARVLDSEIDLALTLARLGDVEDGVPGLVLAGETAETDSSRTAPLSEEDSGRPANEVVSGQARVAEPVSELLEGCWVASDATAASDLFSNPNLDVKKVATREGVILTPHTAQAAGAEGSTALKLAADLEEATKQAETAKVRLDEATERVGAARANFDEAARAREEALEDLRRDDAQRAALAQEQARIAALHHAAQQELERAQEQLVAAKRSVSEAQSALNRLESGSVPPRPEPAEEFLRPYQDALTTAEDELSGARDRATTARMDAHVAEERARAAERQARAFRTQAEQLHADRQRQLQRQDRAQRVVEDAHAVVERAQRGLQSAEKQAQSALKEREAVAAAKQSLGDQKARAQTQLDTLERTRAGAREQLLQAEVAFAQFEGKYDQLREKVEELVEYEPGPPTASSGIRDQGEVAPPSQEATQQDTAEESTNLPAHLEEFIQEFGPYTPFQLGDGEEVPFSREVAVDAQRKAERELSRLGVVNPLAVEEHAALKSRYDFLLEQIDDLNRSKADLLSLIKEVDKQVKEAFIAAFDDTSARFSQVFERLFPGGTGRLELTEPEDPLSTGVEIYARPSGKKVTRLSLLSGGERSLAALAYLIAIFLARPSPFYVMDEVEAALDDTNLGRVLGLFEDLRSESQLLIITHQKRTMEIADALYGVSMRDGVTAVMSHRME